MSTFFTPRRMQLVALLVAAAFSVAAVAVSNTSAAPTAAATKKKTKKCKKGYVKKKVRGRTKCVKKKKSVVKKPVAPSSSVTSVVAGSATDQGGVIYVTGDLTTKVAATTGIKGTINVVIGGQTYTGNAHSYGQGSTSSPFQGFVILPPEVPMGSHGTATATFDGVTSAPVAF